jgi:hypothetical protein
MTGNYLPDGGVIPSGIPFSEVDEREHFKKFKRVRGYIQKAVFKGDPKNITGHLEYVVRINGHDYPGTVDTSLGGGIYNTHTKVRSGPYLDALNPLTAKNAEAKKDGDCVWCIFAGGDGDVPVIVGAAEHPLAEEKNPDWMEPDTANSPFERYEFNGVELLIDKDGNYSIKIVGQKDRLTGQVLNPLPIGTMIVVGADGKIEVYSPSADISVSADQGNITAEATAGDISVKATAGNIAVESGQNVAIKGASGYLTLEGSLAQAKFSGGKIAFGNATAELMDLINKLLTRVDAILDHIIAETHGTGVGPSSPPINVADFTADKADIGVIKTAFATIKGSL